MNIICLIQHQVECNTPHIVDPHENMQRTLITLRIAKGLSSILVDPRDKTRGHAFELHGKSPVTEIWVLHSLSMNDQLVVPRALIAIEREYM